jgi:hypothetical protein
MSRDSNFTERQKAEIYVRDRAHCSYTGIPLWILDVGADPCWPVDWADHIQPVSGRGLSEIANGCCAGYRANIKKSIHPMERVLVSSEPTHAWGSINPKIQCSALAALKRFATLHVSDWYFNRALSRTLFGVVWLYNSSGGYPAGKRGDRYYSASAMNAIDEWRRLSTLLPSLEARDLTPAAPTPDQELLLQLRELESATEVRATMQQLLPVLSDSLRLLRALKAAERSAVRELATAELARLPPWPAGVSNKLARISANEDAPAVLLDLD